MPCYHSSVMAGLFWLLAKTNGTKEAEVLLYLAYNNSKPDNLDGLKCSHKLKLLDQNNLLRLVDIYTAKKYINFDIYSIGT